jgi:hypothetical protein
VECTALALKQRYQCVEAQSVASDISHPPDICLILRAHGEQRWLISEVVSLVRQLEQPGAIADDQVGAALAYLEVLWLDACQRAAETDAARTQLDQLSAPGDRGLHEKARSYHVAVRRLRAAVARRVAALTLAAPSSDAPVDGPITDRYVSS